MKITSPTSTVAAIHRRCSTAAFSLVEVSIAVAMAAVALLAIVGMLPTGVAGSRRVADNTLAANLASDVLSWYRISPWGYVPWMPTNAARLGFAPVTRTAYFDAMGNPPTFLNGSNNTFYSGNYFRLDCSISSNIVFGTGQTGNCNVVNVKVIWPLRGPGSSGSLTIPTANASSLSWVSVYTRPQ